MKRFANSVRRIGSGPLMVDAGTGMVEGKKREEKLAETRLGRYSL